MNVRQWTRFWGTLRSFLFFAGLPAHTLHRLWQGLVEMQKIHTNGYCQEELLAHAHSELNQITQPTVKNLRSLGRSSTGVLRGHEGAPLVVGDTMYLVTRSEHRLCSGSDQAGCAGQWKYEPKQDPDTIPIACCDVVNRGGGYAEGKNLLQSA